MERGCMLDRESIVGGFYSLLRTLQGTGGGQPAAKASPQAFGELQRRNCDPRVSLLLPVPSSVSLLSTEHLPAQRRQPTNPKKRFGAKNSRAVQFLTNVLPVLSLL